MSQCSSRDITKERQSTFNPLELLRNLGGCYNRQRAVVSGLAELRNCDQPTSPPAAVECKLSIGYLATLKYLGFKISHCKIQYFV